MWSQDKIIITENNIYEEQELDFSGLSKIDDLIGDELEKAEKEQQNRPEKTLKGSLQVKKARLNELLSKK